MAQSAAWISPAVSSSCCADAYGAARAAGCGVHPRLAGPGDRERRACRPCRPAPRPACPARCAVSDPLTVWTRPASPLLCGAGASYVPVPGIPRRRCPRLLRNAARIAHRGPFVSPAQQRAVLISTFRSPLFAAPVSPASGGLGAAQRPCCSIQAPDTTCRLLPAGLFHSSARKLYAERGPGASQGRLTEERSLAVRNETLAQVAARLGLARHLRHCALHPPLTSRPSPPTRLAACCCRGSWSRRGKRSKTHTR